MSSSSLWRRSRELTSSEDLVERAVWMRSRRSTRLTRTVETSSRWDSISLATRRLALLERVEPLGRRSWRRPSRPATMSMIFASWRETRSMNSVRVEQVGEAVGLEHDGDRVRRVGLVELDEARGERAAARPAGVPAAESAGRAPGAACSGPARARARLASRLVCSRCWRLESLVMSVCSVLMRRVWLEMSLVSTRSLALWPPISELVAIDLAAGSGQASGPPTSRPAAATREREGGS